MVVLHGHYVAASVAKKKPSQEFVDNLIDVLLADLISRNGGPQFLHFSFLNTRHERVHISCVWPLRFHRWKGGQKGSVLVFRGVHEVRSSQSAFSPFSCAAMAPTQILSPSWDPASFRCPFEVHSGRSQGAKHGFYFTLTAICSFSSCSWVKRGAFCRRNAPVGRYFLPITPLVIFLTHVLCSGVVASGITAPELNRLQSRGGDTLGVSPNFEKKSRSSCFWFSFFKKRSWCDSTDQKNKTAWSWSWILSCLHFR